MTKFLNPKMLTAFDESNNSFKCKVICHKTAKKLFTDKWNVNKIDHDKNGLECSLMMVDYHSSIRLMDVSIKFK